MRDTMKPLVLGSLQVIFGAAIGFAVSQITLGGNLSAKILLHDDKISKVEQRTIHLDEEIGQLRATEAVHMTEAIALFKEEIKIGQTLASVMRDANKNVETLLRTIADQNYQLLKEIKNGTNRSNP